jgi:Domain of unknown function (DUF4394)
MCKEIHMRTTNKSRKRTVFGGLAVLLTMLCGSQALRADGRDSVLGIIFGLKVIGLTDDSRLVSFRALSPQRARDIGYVSGLTGTDTALVGIDFRVQDGKLYGVGNGGGVYTIDTSTAQANFVNSLTVPLAGTLFGVDFNPAADRLRIISDTGQNLAHNVNALGVTATNGTLTYTPPPATAVPALGVSAAAYTNNDLNQPATATTLFDIDTTLDQVVIQSPPGNGILVATGKLGVDAGPSAGFDIYSQLSGGVTVTNVPFATLQVNGAYRFVLVNLTTGQATSLGTFDGAVVDIAIPLNQ